MIPLFIIIPLGTAFIVALFGKFVKWCGDVVVNIANLAVVILSFFVLYKLQITNHGLLTYKVGGWCPPIGILMVVDHLSVLMLLTVNIVALLSTLFSISYMEKYTDKWKYYSLFMLMLAGMNGVIITGDIFNMFVFLEIATIASCALVAFGTESEELEAAFKYLTLGSVASGLILLSIAFIYGHLSTLNLADISLTLKNLTQQQSYIIKFIIVLFIVGFGLKSALVPFHSWLPDAHPSAPAPISAMLSGVFIKTLGIYALIRILYNVFGVTQTVLNILIYLGIFSMIVGGILAMYQWDYKRLLAYSSISQVGYIILGIGLGTPLGILGGIFHLVNHSVFKSLLFLTSGAVEYTLGTRDLRKMSLNSGLNNKMPATTFSTLMASMSISGIPPFNGFWSKLIIIIACVQVRNLFAAFTTVIISVLTLAYFTKVLKYGFYGGETENSTHNTENKEIKEVPFWMRLSMIILVILCITMGLLVILPQLRLGLLNPCRDVLLRGTQYGEIVFKNI